MLKASLQYMLNLNFDSSPSINGNLLDRLLYSQTTEQTNNSQKMIVDCTKINTPIHLPQICGKDEQFTYKKKTVERKI